MTRITIAKPEYGQVYDVYSSVKSDLQRAINEFVEEGDVVILFSDTLTLDDLKIPDNVVTVHTSSTRVLEEKET